MQNVLVIGLGVSGEAAVDYLRSQGFTVSTFDDKQENKEVSLDRIDWIVTSPGIPPTHFLCQEAAKRKIPVVGETELALREICCPVIGITGTNGKTTVTELVAHVLNSTGRKARSVGNHGYPLTRWLLEHKDEDEILVAELSSYQLDMMTTPCLDAAVVLNITPDHLDRYGNMLSYAKSKLHIASCLKKGAPLILYEQIVQAYPELVATLSYRSLPVMPSHDQENEEAAFLLLQPFQITKEEFEKAKETFRKPPHRIEYVRTFEGIDFYDDSKGTNIDAVIKAVNSFDRPLVLIAGGVDKGASYAPWISCFQGKVKALYVIGQAAEKIKRELGEYFPVKMCVSIEEAVEQAAICAPKGGVVLLSPGCSSFDQFKNYVERGKKFQQAVLTLEKNHVKF